MSRVISNATIIQVQSQSLIFRTCAKCSGKVTTIAHIYKDKTTDVLWCDKCNDRVQDCKATYKLDLYICQDDTDSIQAIKAYDKALEPVLGCDAQRFMKLSSIDPKVYDVIEQKLVGLRCHLVLRPQKKRKSAESTTPPVDGIVPLEPDFEPILAGPLSIYMEEDDDEDV